MKKTIFVFDWTGTLDILDDVPGLVAALRENYPECLLTLNSGRVYSIPLEVRKLFDADYFKVPEFEILKEVILEVDHYAKIRNPIPSANIDRVVVVDDQYWSFDSEALKYFQMYLDREGLGHITAHAFISVEEMQEALDEQQDNT